MAPNSESAFGRIVRRRRKALGLSQEAGQPATIEAGLVLLAVSLGCLIYLNQRIRAVEVV